MPVRIKSGEDLIDHVRDYDVVLVGSGIRNVMGNGFHRKVMLNFGYVETADKSTAYADPRKLGLTMFVEPKEDNPYFILCYITRGRMRPDIKPDDLDYDALKSCLDIVHSHFRGKRIASTIMGLSPFEGGGDRERILEIFDERCGDMDITLYDYEQEDYKTENARKWHEIKDLIGKVSKEEYYDMKKKFLWEENFGIYSEMPDISEREIKKMIRDSKNGTVFDRV